MIRKVYIALLAALVIGACADSLVVEPPDIIFPDSDVRFNAHVLPLFEESCATSGCHDAVSFPQAGGLRLTSYTDVLNYPGLVHPNDSATSLLVQVLSRRTPHVRSNTFDAVTANQRRGVAIWVQEGASNN